MASNLKGAKLATKKKATKLSPGGFYLAMNLVSVLPAAVLKYKADDRDESQWEGDEEQPPSDRKSSKRKGCE